MSCCSKIKTMEQKIVFWVQMHCEKSRSKAKTIAAETPGVNYVGLEGEYREKLVVIGNGVDAIKLGCCLRKKLCHADIISLGPVTKT